MSRQALYTLKEYANYLGCSYTQLMSYKAYNNITLLEEQLVNLHGGKLYESVIHRHRRYPKSYLDSMFKGYVPEIKDVALKRKSEVNLKYNFRDKVGTAECDTEWLDEQLVCSEGTLHLSVY